MWKDDRLSCSDAQHEMCLTAALKNVILKALLVDRSNTPKGDGPKQSYRGESAVCGHFIMKLTLKQVFWCQYVLLSEIRSLPRIQSLTHLTHRAIQIREISKVKINFFMCLLREKLSWQTPNFKYYKLISLTLLNSRYLSLMVLFIWPVSDISHFYFLNK